MARNPLRAGRDWKTPEELLWDHVAIEVLMDIRSELRSLNGLLRCHNFLSIPATLRRISRNTAKPRKPRKPRKRKA